MSRAVIVRDGMILLSHETKLGWWLVPGGGAEAGETPETCCIRETEEETGLIVRPLFPFLILYEYYEEYCYISHYYICEITGSGQMHLTDAEKQRVLKPQWLPIQEAVDLFSRHQSYAATNEEKRGSYLREYTALCEYMKYQAFSKQDLRQDERSEYRNRIPEKRITDGRMPCPGSIVPAVHMVP